MINKKPLLIGCSVLIFVAVVLVGVGAFFVFRAVRESMAEISKPPPELSQTGVLVGDGLLAKEGFSNDRRLSQIQEMTFGQVEPGQPDELCAVSGFGAVFLDSSGATKRYVPYGMQQVKVLGMKLQAAGARISRFQIIDIGGTGECSFLARGGPMGAELIGHDGKSVWTLGGGLDPRSHATDMIAGDLNGDGKTEFVGIYELGNKGVALYDASLNELWSKPDMRAYHVELLDADGGKKNIACSAYKRINIIDSQGNLVKTLEIPTYFHAEFMILTWPPRSPTQYLMCHDEDRVDLYDLNGKLRFTCDMPGSSNLERVTAEAFTVGKVSYLAVLGSSRWSGNRSSFCVYGLPEALNQVVHQSPLYWEVLDQSYGSMTKLPADEFGRESILLGGQGKILRYMPSSLLAVPPKPPTSNAGQGKRRSPTGP
jgi:hypothetical protein